MKAGQLSMYALLLTSTQRDPFLVSMVVPLTPFLSAVPESMIDLQQQSVGAAASPASVVFEPVQRKNRTGAKKQSIRNRNQQVCTAIST